MRLVEPRQQVTHVEDELLIDGHRAVHLEPVAGARDLEGEVGGGDLGADAHAFAFRPFHRDRRLTLMQLQQEFQSRAGVLDRPLVGGRFPPFEHGQVGRHRSGVGAFGVEIAIGALADAVDRRQHGLAAEADEIEGTGGAEGARDHGHLQPFLERLDLQDGLRASGNRRQVRLGDVGADGQARMLNPDQRHHPFAALARHDQAARAENFLEGDEARREIHDPPSRRGLGLQKDRRPGRPMRQGEAIPLGLLAHHQLDRIGNELQTLIAAPVVVHERMVDQRQQGGVRVEIEILLTVPAAGDLADGSQRPAILVAQIVEPRVLLVQAFHRDVAAGGPAVGALGRLLHRFDQLRFGIDEPDQPP